jgi:hypothetical protein
MLKQEGIHNYYQITGAYSRLDAANVIAGRDDCIVFTAAHSRPCETFCNRAEQAGGSTVVGFLECIRNITTTLRTGGRLT